MLTGDVEVVSVFGFNGLVQGSVAQHIGALRTIQRETEREASSTQLTTDSIREQQGVNSYYD